MKTVAKIFVGIGILATVLLLGRFLYFAPNNEIDSGLFVSSQNTGGTTINSSSTDLPVKLLIPKLEIDTDVQHVGVTKSGNMAAPNNFVDVGWWKYGTIPGEKGSAVMAGHEDNALSLDGVFKRLGDLEKGDDVYVVDKSGEKKHFRVIDTEIYPYNDAPLDKIFHTDDSSYLVLITCAGDWIPEAKTNDKRLVVYAELVE